MTRADWWWAVAGACGGALAFYLFARWLPGATFPGARP